LPGHSLVEIVITNIQRTNKNTKNR
jgi:hypothetical protein